MHRRSFLVAAPATVLCASLPNLAQGGVRRLQSLKAPPRGEDVLAFQSLSPEEAVCPCFSRGASLHEYLRLFFEADREQEGVSYTLHEVKDADVETVIPAAVGFPRTKREPHWTSSRECHARLVVPAHAPLGRYRVRWRVGEGETDSRAQEVVQDFSVGPVSAPTPTPFDLEEALLRLNLLWKERDLG